MALKLKEVVFRVRCREPGCPFTSDFSVKENIMAATQEDVDSEALKIARDQAVTKHDAIYGRKHPMTKPEIHKVAGAYEQIGAAPAPTTAAASERQQRAMQTAGFDRGERIVAKGERATAVCEVIRGSAVNEMRPGIVYRPGATFGAAALFEGRRRMASIVAAEDGTLVGFYDMRELTRTDPAKAHELYNEAMEDIFNVLAYLEQYSASLEKKLAKLRAATKVKAKKKPAPRPAKKVAKKPAAKKLARKPSRKPTRKPARKSARR
jgi:CRP-like cAMP-binding protein